MTLPVLKQIAGLAEAGATILGEAPQGSPSLKDDKAMFDTLVRRLWSGQPATTIGQGKVIAGRDVEAALASIGVGPDFTCTKPHPGSEILFIHRRLTDGDLYFVDNRKDRAEHCEARFHVTGKAPEIWHADTGTAESVSYRIEGSETVVPLDMDPEESFFVVFRAPTAVPSVTIDKPQLSSLAILDGSWSVAFQPNRGAPASISIASLGSLSEHEDPGVKYFSGIATYTKSFVLPKGAAPKKPLLLDLGKVGDLAEVRVNGTLVGTVWHAPYRLDIGQAVKPGRNQLEIRVADLWVNRLIGDAQPGAAKITFTAMPAYTAKAPLRPSGLIGPVTLMKMGR
jgi:hypothetical protein